MIPGQHQPHESGVDPLDGLLRQALQRNTPSVQPPKRIWERIQGQVTAGPAPTSHRPPAERLSRLLAPFVQGIAAAVVLILVGLSLVSNRGVEPRQVEAIPPRPNLVVVAESVLRPPAASVQRMGRFAAEDDTIDYGLGQNRVERSTPQIGNATRLSLISGDPDMDLALNSRYVPDMTRRLHSLVSK